MNVIYEHYLRCRLGGNSGLIHQMHMIELYAIGRSHKTLTLQLGKSQDENQRGLQGVREPRKLAKKMSILVVDGAITSITYQIKETMFRNNQS